MPKEKNKSLLVLAIILVIFSLVFLLIALNIKSLIVLQEQEISIMVNIGNKNAINVSRDQEIFSLGSVASGSFGQRNLTLSNDYSFPIILEFSVEGEIKDILIYGEVIYLEAGQDVGIPFYTKIIENESLGVYSGTLNVIFRRAPVQ